MRPGKLTLALLRAPVLLAAYLLPFILVGLIFKFRHSVSSLLVSFLTFLLVRWGAGRLEKRWPTVLGTESLDGGPRLTIARAVILCGSILLCLAGAVYVLASKQQATGPTLLVYGVMFCVLLVIVYLLEGRWLAVDQVKENEARANSNVRFWFS